MLINCLENENMDPLEVERSSGSTRMENKSYNIENLSRLFDESAIEMAAYRDSVVERMWINYNT